MKKLKLIASYVRLTTCLLLHRNIGNTYMRSFQYKILNNLLFLNKELHTFGTKPPLLCSFCHLYDKRPYHMVYECDRVKCLWSDLVQCFQHNVILPTNTRRCHFWVS